MSAADSCNSNQLKSFVERIEKLESDKRDLMADIKDVKQEAKGAGFDIKAITTIIKIRNQDPDERSEHEAILATYMAALGMIPPFELARAA